ncbi:MAG: replication-associated recombination protein A [Planctomycetota bacterium]|nr:replication-associated recombination protein A [Planctomycetota bacterium]
MSLFEKPVQKPLADRMRPLDLDEFLGQDQLLGPGKALREAIEEGKAGSLILFGPPGVGKTTLALLIARASNRNFEQFSAVLNGIKDVRAAVERADEVRRMEGKGTLLFVDEIHRFNKAQQDAFLPLVESGKVVLIGATTENPAFSVIAPLLSRCRVLQLSGLAPDCVAEVIRRALDDAMRGLGKQALSIDDAAVERLTMLAGGDARRALTILEACSNITDEGGTITVDSLTEAAQHRTLIHDKSGDQHYDLLSAFHKSLRNSDVQACVYWMARMLEAGVDPLQPARRMVAMAAEDIGLADPMALQVATSALVAVQNLGLPEGRLPLTEAAIYLAQAPKSNAVYRAISAATELVREGEQHQIPLQLRNAVTGLAKELGHGVGYRYAHDCEDGVAPMQCLPEDLKGQVFFKPTGRGFEAKVIDRMASADHLREGRDE